MKTNSSILEKNMDYALRELRYMPEGRLKVRKRDSGTITCELVDQRNGHYFSKGITNDDEIVAKLARKAYLEAKVDILKNDLDLMDTIVDIFVEPSHENVLRQLPKSFTNLDDRYFFPYAEKYRDWMFRNQEENLMYLSDKKNITGDGKKVRSKSEVTIYEEILSSVNPFLYEPRLLLERHEMSPDFAVAVEEVGPRERGADIIDGMRVKYWEHYGKMDDPSYVESFYSRVEIYKKFGINIGDNLIVTFETKECPLSTEEVRAIVRRHFPMGKMVF